MTPLLPPSAARATRRRTIITWSILAPLAIGLAVLAGATGRHPHGPAAFALSILLWAVLGPSCGIWALVELVARVRARHRGVWAGRLWPWVLVTLDAAVFTVAPGLVILIGVMNASLLLTMAMIRRGRGPSASPWPPPPWPAPPPAARSPSP